MQIEELQGIVAAYLDGQLDDAQQRKLSAELASSESSRREFWKRVQQEALLAQVVLEAGGQAAARPTLPMGDRPIVAAPRTRGAMPPRWRRACLAACLALLVVSTATAAIPGARQAVVVWLQAVVGSGDEGDDAAPAEPTEAQSPASPAKSPAPVAAPQLPLAAPKLADEQKIGIWKWDKFHWNTPDAALVRRVRFSATVPTGHKFCTFVVEDSAGLRVRNLLDMVETEKLGGDPKGGQPQQLVVEWNGLDDRGQPAPAGEYRVRGCSLPGLKAIYEYSFLNPGSPPWEHYKNSGWGGDHEYPNALACLRAPGDGAWRVVLGGRTAEGGSPGFVLGADDRKVHAFGRGWSGPASLAAEDGLIWIGLGGGKDLQRIHYHRGGNAPFATAQGPKAALAFAEDVSGIALGPDWAAVLLVKKDKLKEDHILILDKQTGATRRDLPTPAPGVKNGLVCDASGRLLMAADKGLWVLDVKDPQANFAPLALPGVELPGVLAVDAQKNLYVFDRGADSQVKVFDPQNKPLRTIGVKGGQGARLEYDPDSFHHVVAISVADDGQLWAADTGEFKEGTGFVRRIAVWDGAGKFNRQFVGTTWYSANTTCLHEQDPTLGYGYGMIYKVREPGKPSYRPWKFASSAKKPGGAFSLWTGAPGVLFNGIRMFRSDVSGTMREYLLQSNGFPILLQANAQGDYRPILAIGHHGQNAAFPKVAGVKNAVHLWTDLNGDELCQPEEFQFIPAEDPSVQWWAGWGYPPPLDLTWRVGGRELKPVRFNDAGVPVYDMAQAKRLQAGPHHYVRVGQHLVATVGGRFNSDESGVFWAGRYLFTDLEGRWKASYRNNWPAVHPSWQAQLYKPGQTGRTTGEMFWGVVRARSQNGATAASTQGTLAPELGDVLCIQGNKGQSFLFTDDGLFLSTLFRDVRESPQGWGDQEVPGADWSQITLYDEAFGGWFGRQDDGVFRYMFGRNGCHVVRVEGLEDARRWQGSAAVLPALDRKHSPAVDPLRIPNVQRRIPAFQADGDLIEWEGIPRHEIRQQDRVVARVALAHSVDSLWVSAEVEDASPAVNVSSDEGGDPRFAFKTGDAIDLQLGPLSPAREVAGERDVRVLLVPGEKKHLAVIYRAVKADAKPETSATFESPVRKVVFAYVKSIDGFDCVFKKTARGYLCEARLPAEALAAETSHRVQLRGDIGVLFSHAGGETTQSRAYLLDATPEAGIVTDTPTEAELHPAAWGHWMFE